MKRIALASDHAGFALKSYLIEELSQRNYDCVDCGTFSAESVDYPDSIPPAPIRVVQGDCDAGIVLGGSGNGEAMAANKIQGARCALVWNEESARLARQHNNANLIAMGERLLDREEALRLTLIWLEESFEGGRHVRRIEKLNQMGQPIS